MSINWINLIIITVQIIGGTAMIFTIVISIKQYLLQRREVKIQNQMIVTLLGKIHDELIYARLNKYTQTEKEKRG